MNKLKTLLFAVLFAATSRADTFLQLGHSANWASGAITASGTGSISILKWDITLSKWEVGMVANRPGGNGSGRAYTVQLQVVANQVQGTNTSAGTKLLKLDPGTTYNVTHWLSVTGQSQSNGPNFTFTTPAAPVSPKNGIINLRNRWKVPVRYKVMQDGVVLRQLDLEPGKAVSFQIQTLSDGYVTITEQPLGWSINPTTGEYEETPGTDGPENYVTTVDPNSFSSQPNQTPNPTPVVPPAMEMKGEVGTTTANPAGAGTGPIFQNTATGAADNQTYREGVGILNAQLQGINDKLAKGIPVTGSTGGGGGATDMTATNALLTTANANTSDIKTALTGGESHAAVTALSETPAELSPSSITAKITGKLPAAPTVVVPVSATEWSVTFTIPGYSTPTTIGFDLTNYSGAIAIFRGIALAGLALLFFFITLKAVRGAFA